MDKDDKNWKTYSAIDNEQQNPSNPILHENELGKKELTWEEIRRHSNKKDRWLVIDNRVYDVTKWLKHPGGQMVLNHYAGQDASEAFRAFHPDLTFVQKHLKLFYIGDIIKDEDNIDEDQALKDDFEKLRQKSISQKLFQSNRLFFLIQCLHILVLEFAASYVLFRFGTNWIPYLTALTLYVIVQVQCSWVQHDFGHLSVFKQSKWNHLLHEIYIGLMKGTSAGWWNHMHFQHHSKPNVIDKDPDTRLEPIFVLGNKMPIRAAHRNFKYGKTFPYHFQYLYFFIGNKTNRNFHSYSFFYYCIFNILAAPLSISVYFTFTTIRYMIKWRKWMDFVWISLYAIKFHALTSLKLSFIQRWKFYFLLRIFEGFWFVLVTQSNHVTMDISDDDVKSSWFRMQLRGTCNIEKSYFNDWFTGHLNFQIEHHLFPLMPRHNLYKIQPDVIDLCRKYNIPYIVKPMGRAFFDILTSMEKSGRMWREAYEELINASQNIT